MYFDLGIVLVGNASKSAGGTIAMVLTPDWY